MAAARRARALRNSQRTERDESAVARGRQRNDLVAAIGDPHGLAPDRAVRGEIAALHPAALAPDRGDEPLSPFAAVDVIDALAGNRAQRGGELRLAEVVFGSVELAVRLGENARRLGLPPDECLLRLEPMTDDAGLHPVRRDEDRRL